MAKKRLILTFATGHTQYHTMAKALAVTLKWHGTKAELACFTDAPNDAEHRDLFDHLLPPPTDLDHWFIKLGGLKYTDADQILFIDGDCLALKNIDYIFDELEGTDFAVQGHWITEVGDWYGDFTSVMKREGVERASKFSGGFMYYERTEKAQQLIDLILEYRDRYDELGLRRNGGKVVDEVCISLAMGKSGIGYCAPNERQYSETPWYRNSPVKLDVITGVVGWTSVMRGLHVIRPAIYHTAMVRWDFAYWRETARVLKLYRKKIAPDMVHHGAWSKIRFRTRRLLVMIYRKLFLGGI